MVEAKHRKIVVAGSRSVGKSAVTIQFACKRFEPNYHPTIESTYKKEIKHKNKTFEAHIIDTAGQEEFSIFQQQYAIGVDGYALVYSITSKQSFDLIKVINQKILNSTANEKIPRIIVGNKTDLQDQRKISFAQGEALAKELGCSFIECSALKNEHIDDIFMILLTKIEGDELSPSNKGSDGTCNIL